MEYILTGVANAFGAPVFRVAETESTMRDAQELAKAGAADGTVIYADFQTAGRGRVDGRVWKSRPGENLLCTTILWRKPVTGFTIRVGLAAARAFDAFLPGAGNKLGSGDGLGAGVARVKWPNDVIIGGKKAAGILCENDGECLFVGAGLNLGQLEFPPELESKATSLALAIREATSATRNASSASAGIPSREGLPSREALLQRFLTELKAILESDSWLEDATMRLWKRGERATLVPGDPEKDERIEGTVEGLGASGELLFRQADSGEIRRVFSGEFRLS